MLTWPSANSSWRRRCSHCKRHRRLPPRGCWRASDDRRATRCNLWQQLQRARTTSNMSEAQAEASRKALAREKQQQDAVNSDTVAIDFAGAGGPPAPAPTPNSVLGEREQAAPKASARRFARCSELYRQEICPTGSEQESKPNPKSDHSPRMTLIPTMDALFRSSRGRVLEGVVTNHSTAGQRTDHA